MGVAGDSFLVEGWLQGVDASKILIALLPVWILGALIGMLVRVYSSYTLHKLCERRSIVPFCANEPACSNAYV